MNVSKRTAISSDTDFARNVHHRAYRDVIIRQYGTWSRDDQDKFFADAWSTATHEILLCDSVRCGYTCIEKGNREIYIRELVIDPDFQCQGIGTYVIKDVLAEATTRQIRSVCKPRFTTGLATCTVNWFFAKRVARTPIS